MIDEEISKNIRNAQKRSQDILNENQELLHSMAKALLKHETIDAKDINKLLDGKKIIRRVNGKNLKTGRKKSNIKLSRQKAKSPESNGSL
jgi:cell division protease FtsH